MLTRQRPIRVAVAFLSPGTRLRVLLDLSQHHHVNRALRPRERAALDTLLAAEFAGVGELRAQAETALAANDTLVVDLIVDSSLPKAVVSHRVPVEAPVDGAGYDGGLILYVDDGRLSALEYWWVTEEPPNGFPPAVAISTPDCVPRRCDPMSTARSWPSHPGNCRQRISRLRQGWVDMSG